MNPYVVSGDVKTLFLREGFDLPKDPLEQFYLGICNSLTDMFGSCDLISEAELMEGIQDLLGHSDLPIVSLDKVYAHNQALHIDVSRLHNKAGDVLGYGTSKGEFMTLEEQVKDIAMYIGKEIALEDDVLFSGTGAEELIKQFLAIGVEVRRIYAGVAVGDAIAKVQELGSEVKAVRVYPKVVDEVCARDFVLGAPLSGRTVAGLPNTGIPYLLPYGRLGSWASIPDAHGASFSAACLRLTAAMYQEMGIRQVDLPRNIYGLEARNDILFHEHLMEVSKGLISPIGQ